MTHSPSQSPRSLRFLYQAFCVDHYCNGESIMVVPLYISFFSLIFSSVLFPQYYKYIHDQPPPG